MFVRPGHVDVLDGSVLSVYSVWPHVAPAVAEVGEEGSDGYAGPFGDEWALSVDERGVWAVVVVSDAAAYEDTAHVQAGGELGRRFVEGLLLLLLCNGAE